MKHFLIRATTIRLLLVLQSAVIKIVSQQFLGEVVIVD